MVRYDEPGQYQPTGPPATHDLCRLCIGALGGGLVAVVDVLVDEGALLLAQVVGEAVRELPDGILDVG